MVVSATKVVSGGSQVPGGTVIYTVTLHNTGTGAQADNPGNELTDPVPAPLVVGTPTASSGTISAPGVNPVTWNGPIPAGGTVTITIPATIPAATPPGTTINNQGTVSYDSDGDMVNDTTVMTDGPGATVGDPTPFVVGAAPAAVPTLSDLGLVVLALMLSSGALFVLRRRRERNGE